jgi:formylglycine-generating enzyme required for sulfatase activity
MKFILASVLSASLAVAAQPLTTSADGKPMASPIDKSVVEIRDGSRTIQIPAGMVYVPSGQFTFGMGADAKILHLDAFCIGRYEVTNAEYKTFLDAERHRTAPRYWKAGKFPEGKANHPVLFISLDDAEAYCQWISSKTGWQVVIPSAEQWEKAARGPKNYLYPWGNDKDSRVTGGKLTAHFNYNAVCAAYMLEKEAKTLTSYVEKSSQAGKEGRLEDIMTGNGKVFSLTSDGGVNAWIDHKTNTGFVNTVRYRELVDNGGYTTPVGSFPTGKSAYGCFDMAGNAYEWTRSIIIATNGAERGKEVYDVRGGSWYSTGRSGQSICTGEGRNRSGAYHSVGFRIAMELSDRR